MQGYQHRVIAEKSALDTKLDFLTKFIEGPRFAEVNEEEQRRMQRQQIIMLDYSHILQERIEHFPKDEDGQPNT